MCAGSGTAVGAEGFSALGSASKPASRYVRFIRKLVTLVMAEEEAKDVFSYLSTLLSGKKS